MNLFHRVLGVTACLYLATSPLVLAEQPVTDDVRRMAEEYQVKANTQNLRGWNGILFFCQFDKESDPALKGICITTEVNAAFLAAAAKVTLMKARSDFEVLIKAATGDQLVLEVNLHATHHGVPAAIHAGVRAYVHYDEAVTTGMPEARLTPRSGDLIFWERGVIGASSGPAQNLALSLSQGIEDLLKEFFADYLKAQR